MRIINMMERHGLPSLVLRNPTEQLTKVMPSTRGLVTESDLYVWQNISMLHTDFERKSGISGVHIALRTNEIQINHETIDQPEHFPWIFTTSVNDLDMEQRRKIVETWLESNPRLKHIYPTPPQSIWYS